MRPLNLCRLLRAASHLRLLRSIRRQRACSSFSYRSMMCIVLCRVRAEADSPRPLSTARRRERKADQRISRPEHALPTSEQAGDSTQSGLFKYKCLMLGLCHGHSVKGAVTTATSTSRSASRSGHSAFNIRSVHTGESTLLIVPTLPRRNAWTTRPAASVRELTRS